MDDTTADATGCTAQTVYITHGRTLGRVIIEVEYLQATSPCLINAGLSTSSG